MALTTEQSQQIARSLLADKEYRHIFVDESINAGIAFQIRELRGEMSQADVAENMPGGTSAQGRISDYENPDYGKFQLGTLKRLAAAFDVGLIVRFVPFSELVDWASDLSPERIRPPGCENDTRLHEQAGALVAQLSLKLPPANLRYITDHKGTTSPRIPQTDHKTPQRVVSEGSTGEYRHAR